MRRIIFSFLACSLFAVLCAQDRVLSKFQYWFDQKVEMAIMEDLNETNMQPISYSLGTNTFSSGLHSLYYRIQGSEEQWSPLYSWIFMVQELSINDSIRVTHMEYWVDSLYSQRKVMDILNNRIDLMYDASNLSEGLHTLNFRIKDNEGMYSPFSSWLFMRTPLCDASLINKAEICEYWFDNDISFIQQEEIVDTTLIFVTNVSKLGEGLHTLNYRVKDTMGNYSPIQKWKFMRNTLRDTSYVNRAAIVEYWFDNRANVIQSCVPKSDTISFSVNASPLEYGLHTLNYRAKDLLGNYSATQRWTFFKSGPKATKVSWYKYWWNNHEDKATKETVEADSVAFLFEKELIVPDYAMSDGYSANSIARFQIVFGDDMGNVSNVEWADVTYPDVIPPISTIKADKKQAGESVILTWKANERNIENYNIYYSENDQPFVLWLPNTTKTTATFKGQPGKTYRFTATACDKAGNREKIDENKFTKVIFTN